MQTIESCLERTGTISLKLAMQRIVCSPATTCLSESRTLAALCAGGLLHKEKMLAAIRIPSLTLVPLTGADEITISPLYRAASWISMVESIPLGYLPRRGTGTQTATNKGERRRNTLHLLVIGLSVFQGDPKPHLRYRSI